MKKRLGIHSLIAVSMLIGFGIVLSGMLLAVLTDYADIATRNSGCILSDVSLYDVGERAYLVVSLRNVGSGVITAANVTFVDDDGTSHGFGNSSLAVAPGDAWRQMDSFSATVSDKEYIVRASATTEDGSVIECFNVQKSG